jgi:hypothetical protein
MMRKYLLACLTLLSLAGILAATEPQLVQFVPGPNGPCYGPIKTKPVIVHKIYLPQIVPLEQPAAAPSSSEAQVPITSSGPLNPAQAKPAPGSNDVPGATKLAPPIESPDLKPQDKNEPKPAPSSEIIEPNFKPASGIEEPSENPIYPMVSPMNPVNPPIGIKDQQKEETPPISPIGPTPPLVKPEPPQPKPLEILVPGGKPGSPWVIRVEVIKSVTHLIATSKNTEFHVQCQNLKVQSPTGDIQAEGKITVTAGELDMNCERLKISWQDDWVVLEGKVRLQTQKGGQQVELASDKLQLKLTSLNALRALKKAKSPLQQAAYPPTVTETITPAAEIVPTAAPMGQNTIPAFLPAYKRVTTDNE